MCVIVCVCVCVCDCVCVIVCVYLYMCKYIHTALLQLKLSTLACAFYVDWLN